MRHLVIPDTQVKPYYSTDHLEWAGKYAVKMKPDRIIHLGDHWDMPSLALYDKGKIGAEGQRVIADINAGNIAMDRFLGPIRAEQQRQRKNKEKVWRPSLIFCMGNHEHRIIRATENDPMLDGFLTLNTLNLSDWEVHDFLEVVVVDGVAYSHYFVSGIMGRPVTSARALLNKKHQSCVMGHVQDRDIDYQKRADGTRMTGLFAGIFYPHEEKYLNPQTNDSWRGVWVLHDVKDGSYDEMPVSLSFLEERYG